MSAPVKKTAAAALQAPAPANACFHCGLPVPPGADYAVSVDGVRAPFCCRGCEAVARAILDAGLGDYYRYRTGTPPRARELVPEFLRDAAVYDHPEVQRSFVRREGEHRREAALILEGIVCAACVWLNEQQLARLPGVVAVQINYATRRARVVWDERRLRLSDILQAVARIGYQAHPYDPQRSQELLERERRLHLRRLAVAAVFGMQVMILAVALYFGALSGMEEPFRNFFHGMSLLLTIPVLAYAGRPFFQSAWRDLKNRRAGMDVPVALGLGLAFLGSLWATATGEGEVYYDSVVMFVFLLLAGRYFELAARQRAAGAGEALVRATPAMATRLAPDEREERVAAVELRPGDRVLIRPGEPVPADGVVLAGRSSVDESLLTGESRPLARAAGERLIGGSINIESPLTLEVEHTGPDTVLSAVLRLLERASAEKPALVQAADRAAGWFVARLLVLASAVALYWYLTAPEQWLPITVAVLVVSCPCALSLAAPTALTVASGRLMRQGLLATRGHALETLARASHFVFDKTGTLTLGRLRLQEMRDLSGRRDWLARAAALERHSEHPVARALVEAASGGGFAVSDVLNTPGGGIEGEVAGERFFVGAPGFIRSRTGRAPAAGLVEELGRRGGTLVLVATHDALHGALVFDDGLRPGAAELVQALKAQGKTVVLLSGDQESAVRQVAEALGIEDRAWTLSPADKLQRIRRLQADGAVVAMIGDGVNDAPVLAGADVSIALGGGAQVAAAASDMILLSTRLAPLTEALAIARRTLRIIRQNLGWAVAYNLLAIPAAALGLVTPWLAAVGMSLSSLVVVGNALRLNGKAVPRQPFPADAMKDAA